MSDYIEREKAIYACFDGWNNEADDCAENIRSIPAADVRPVVLCKDCKNRFNIDVCKYRGDDWFCGYGE